MQLHTHNQIAHVAFTRLDGKWRAPDSTAYYEHARAAAQVASAHAEAALMRVTRLGRDGCASRVASPALTQDEITRAAQKALEKCSGENSKWTRGRDRQPRPAVLARSGMAVARPKS